MGGRRKQAAGPTSQQDVMEERSVSGTATAWCGPPGAHAIRWGLWSPVMPEPSSPWGRESDTAPRERKMTQGHASSPGPHAEHKTEAPTLSRPEEEADSRRRRKRRGGGSRGKSLGPCPAAHTEADAAGVAQPPLPPRLRQMFIFNPVGSEMLSHSATSYQSQIISITCLLTLPPATQPAACKKGVLQVLPCLLEETIIIIITPSGLSPGLLLGVRNPPTCSPRLRQMGRAQRGHPCAAGKTDHQQKGPAL